MALRNLTRLACAFRPLSLLAGGWAALMNDAPRSAKSQGRNDERSSARPANSGRTRAPFANALFFPAATLYAAIVLPFWVGGLLGIWSMPAELDFVTGHAHEMLLGFGMAVVAGYLLGPQPMFVTLTLLGLWLIARISFHAAPDSVITLTSTALFAAGVAWQVVPRYGLAAKKWRNRVVAPTVATLALISFSAPGILLHPAFDQIHAAWVLHAALLLLTLLMFFMGGRILAGAIAGQLKRRRLGPSAGVQPRLEGTALLALIGALLLVPTQHPMLNASQGMLLGLAGVLTWARLLRWRLWHCLDRPDLLALAMGYAWLGIETEILHETRRCEFHPLPSTVARMPIPVTKDGVRSCNQAHST